MEAEGDVLPSVIPRKMFNMIMMDDDEYNIFHKLELMYNYTH